MRASRRLRLAALVALLCAGPALAGTDRFGVIIGNNRGQDPARALRYAERDAQKLHDVLVERGGFQPGQLRLLLGQSADQVRRALGEMDARLEEHKQEGRPSLFLVFYSGHADGDVLELGETALGFDELREFLQRSRATARVAFVDSCQSGKLVARKAGRRVPGYQIRVDDELSTTGYAIVTSSAGDELSQESAEIRGSFFTHYLVSALRGAADQTGDGRITLNEAYQYAYNRTVARTSRSVGGEQHPMYDFRLAGQGDVVLARVTDSGSALAIEPPRPGRIVVLDQARERMVAEADARSRKVIQLGMPPGSYRIYCLAAGELHAASARVAPGQVTRVPPEAFSEARLERTLAKGGLFTPRWRHQLDGGFLVRRWPLEGGALSYGSSLQYRLGPPEGFIGVARLAVTAAPDSGAVTGYVDLDLLLGIGRAFRWGWVTLRAEVLAGYEHLFQDSAYGDLRHSDGFAYLGLVTLETPLGPLKAYLGGGAGGRVFKVREQGVVHRLDLQAVLGIGFDWGAE